MKRSMMQVYVEGSAEALALYQRAFDAPVVCSYPNPDGTLVHAELDVQGQIVALSEADYGDGANGQEAVTGNTMQFCFHYGEGNEAMVERAYDALKEGGKVAFPLGPCEYSPLMADVTDRFGVRWCLFV